MYITVKATKSRTRFFPTSTLKYKSIFLILIQR